MKAKLYAIAAARTILWLFFSVLYVPFFIGFIVLQVCEWFISFYESYKQETTVLLTQFEEQLKKNV